MTAVHSVLPDALAAAVEAVLGPAGVRHVAHGEADPVGAAEAAASDAGALALIGPFRSAAVAEAVEASAPAGLALLAPVATWAGVTRDDEPGCQDAADHRGTVLRMVARDTEVAARLAAGLRGRRAYVVAGDHDYGRQLDGQLRLGGLERADGPDDADLVVLCGLTGHPEIARATALAPLPIVAFSGVEGSDLGGDVQMALPMAPAEGDPFGGTLQAGRAAELVVEALAGGAADRPTMLAALRALGPFDAHGDLLDPPVWLWRAGADWTLEPVRAL